MVVAAAVVIGCGGDDPTSWESTAAGDRLYVLNKRTGEVLTLPDGELRTVARNTDAIWDGPPQPVDHERLAREHVVDRRTDVMGDLLEIKVRSKYRHGQVEVRGTISPYIDGLAKLYVGPLFGLEFSDRDSFRVVEVGVDAGQLVNVVGSDGRPGLFQFVTRAEVSAEDWLDAQLLNVTWKEKTETAVSAWAKANPEQSQARRDVVAARRAPTARVGELMNEGPREIPQVPAGVAGE
jgi:hypothetical protein